MRCLARTARMRRQTENVDFDSVEAASADTDGVIARIANRQGIWFLTLGNECFDAGKAAGEFVRVKEKGKLAAQFGSSGLKSAGQMTK